jgi:putative ABC transport system permease protein
LKKNPAIRSIAARKGGSWTTIARVDGNQIEFTMETVDTSYLSTLGIPLVEGRNLSSLYPSDSTQSVLVNQAFMKKAGWHDIRNKQVDFYYDSIKYNVVGVVKDYHYESLLTEVRPQLFCMHPKYKYGELIIKIDPAHASSALAHIGKVFKAQQPFTPYKYEFKDNSNEAQYAAEKKAKQVISFAAILCIFISCIGLFGLATLSAEKRTKEIGIRKVLGASVSGIAGMLSMSFLRLVFIAALIAFPAAWWATNKWLEHYPYRIQVGVWVFVFAGMAVVLIALCTVSFQAIRKAIANPVRSLRTE